MRLFCASHNSKFFDARVRLVYREGNTPPERVADFSSLRDFGRDAARRSAEETPKTQKEKTPAPVPQAGEQAADSPEVVSTDKARLRHKIDKYRALREGAEKEFKGKIEALFDNPGSIAQLVVFVENHALYSSGDAEKWNREFCETFFPDENRENERYLVCALQLTLNDKLRKHDSERNGQTENPRGYPFRERGGTNQMTLIDGWMGAYTISALVAYLNCYHHSQGRDLLTFASLMSPSDKMLAQYNPAIDYLDSLFPQSAPSAINPASDIAAGTTDIRREPIPVRRGDASAGGEAEIAEASPVAARPISTEIPESYQFRNVDLSHYRDTVNEYYNTSHYHNLWNLEQMREPDSGITIVQDFLEKAAHSNTRIRGIYHRYKTALRRYNDAQTDREREAILATIQNNILPTLRRAVNEQKNQAIARIAYWSMPGRLPTSLSWKGREDIYSINDARAELFKILPDRLGSSKTKQSFTAIDALFSNGTLPDSAFGSIALLRQAAGKQKVQDLQRQLENIDYLSLARSPQEANDKDDKTVALVNARIWLHNLDIFQEESASHFLRQPDQYVALS